MVLSLARSDIEASFFQTLGKQKREKEKQKTKNKTPKPKLSFTRLRKSHTQFMFLRIQSREEKPAWDFTVITWQILL